MPTSPAFTNVGNILAKEISICFTKKASRIVPLYFLKTKIPNLSMIQAKLTDIER